MKMHLTGGIAILRKYRMYIILTIIISCIYASVFFLYSVDKVSGIYIQQSKDSILQLKKTFLKDTVDNLINEIDVERNTQSEIISDIVNKEFAVIDFPDYLNNNDFENQFITRFETDSNNSFWSIVIWDSTTNKEVYDPEDIIGENWSGNLEQLDEIYSSYKLIKHSNLTAVFGVKASYIEDVVKNITINKIRNSKYSEESYIWVNEVINYEGGENYAVRKVHPNLPETEGMYLSTDMSDGYGNYPYLEELEGVNENGEIFFTYYFKKFNSDVVSQKVTYSKLYKDYNWIVAMGVHLDDIQAYLDQTQDKSRSITSKLTIALVIIFIIILIISFSILRGIDRWYYKHNKKVMESEINHDSLTNANSRRSGTNDLIYFFKKFKKDKESPAILLIDVDYFKDINDTFGHDFGDEVLKEVVKTIYQVVRSSDRLIRWGGDEFVGVFYGLKEENALIFSQKILNDISSIEIFSENKKITISVSIGLSYFNENDIEYLDVLKRADEAMYTSKREGRNRVNIL